MATSEEYKALKDDIRQLCNRSDRKGPDNILLVGKTGAGKSALVNTLIRAVSGQYFDRAKVGAGDTASKTLQFVLYNKCGVVVDDLGQKRAVGVKELPMLSNVYKNCGVVVDDLGKNSAVGVKELQMLNNVYDMPGLGDSLGDDNKEIISLILAGRIPDQTDITEIKKRQAEDGIGNLDLTFKTTPDSAKIDKVVFVQSAVDTIPTQLINGIQEVLKETDPKTCSRIHNSDIFLLITHCDLVRDDPPRHDQENSADGDDHSTTAAPKKYISKKEFEAKEKQLARLFHIEGNLKGNRMHWTSLCDDTGYDDADICANALEFLKIMMSPTRRSAPPKTVVTLQSRAQVRCRRLATPSPTVTAGSAPPKTVVTSQSPTVTAGSAPPKTVVTSQSPTVTAGSAPPKTSPSSMSIILVIVVVIVVLIRVFLIPP